MIQTVFWAHRGVGKSEIAGHSLLSALARGGRWGWGGGRGRTVVGDDGTELLVVLGEGGGDCVYVEGDGIVLVVVCGGDAGEVEGAGEAVEEREHGERRGYRG